jgi:ubiquitin-protein ligase
MRRIAADWEQVQKDFAGHKNIMITPVGGEPPEKYHITYFLNGIYLLPDGRIETLGRHEVEIILHADYPRYKPICKILTPIWHPNFRDGQICIGDIWGAGESLSDIIVNIGDMIQYKSWNSTSPLSADAAQWALENKHLFPVGTINLYSAENTAQPIIDDVSIDISESVQPSVVLEKTVTPENDFEITPEELEGIEFIPTAERMQANLQAAGSVKGSINIKTIITKGVLWAVVGAIIGFGVSELFRPLSDSNKIAKMMGNTHLSQYYEYQEKANDALESVIKEYTAYCEENGYDENDTEYLLDWYTDTASDDAKEALDLYFELDDEAENELYSAYRYEFSTSETKMKNAMAKSGRISSAIWSAIVALFIGLSLGIGEGIFYGSKEKAIQYGLIGAGISIALGYASGYVAQWMYASLLGDDSSTIAASFIRGIGWAVMGIGIGAAVGLIKPNLKRILYCCIGGAVGAFIGGFLFNFIGEVILNDMVSRGVGLLIMGILIGVGVGLLEQFAKQAWLKVIRGEFEGKEYLLFNGTTSIGNNGKNTIVLFKDNLVSPHHCDIILEGGRFFVNDCGSPNGILVNGRRVQKQVLRQGDAISIGNSVLVFNTK